MAPQWAVMAWDLSEEKTDCRERDCMYVWLNVCNVCMHASLMQFHKTYSDMGLKLKEETSRNGGNMQIWRCLVSRPFLKSSVVSILIGWANLKLFQQWTGRETVQDVDHMPESLTFLWSWKECFYSRPVSWSFVTVTDLHSLRPLLSLMPNIWFTATLISTTHSHPPQYTLTSCPTAWPPAGSTEGAKRLRNASKWNTHEISREVAWRLQRWFLLR